MNGTDNLSQSAFGEIEIATVLAVSVSFARDLAGLGLEIFFLGWLGDSLFGQLNLKINVEMLRKICRFKWFQYIMYGMCCPLAGRF